MRRKSERNKSKTVAEKKSTEQPARKTRRQSRRKKRSASRSSSDDSDDAPLKPVSADVQESEAPAPEEPKKVATPPTTEEDKQEQPIWKVKTSDTSSGEIQKLKICLQRPPSTPERTEKSPRRRRTKASSQSDDAYLTPDEKPAAQGRRRLRRGSPVVNAAEGTSMEASKSDAVDTAEQDVVEAITDENEISSGKGKLECSQTRTETEIPESVQDSQNEESQLNANQSESGKKLNVSDAPVPPEQETHAERDQSDNAKTKPDQEATVTEHTSKTSEKEPEKISGEELKTETKKQNDTVPASDLNTQNKNVSQKQKPDNEKPSAENTDRNVDKPSDNEQAEKTSETQLDTESVKVSEVIEQNKDKTDKQIDDCKSEKSKIHEEISVADSKSDAVNSVLQKTITPLKQEVEEPKTLETDASKCEVVDKKKSDMGTHSSNEEQESNSKTSDQETSTNKSEISETQNVEKQPHESEAELEKTSMEESKENKLVINASMTEQPVEKTKCNPENNATNNESMESNNKNSNPETSEIEIKNQTIEETTATVQIPEIDQQEEKQDAKTDAEVTEKNKTESSDKEKEIVEACTDETITEIKDVIKILIDEGTASNDDNPKVELTEKIEASENTEIINKSETYDITEITEKIGTPGRIEITENIEETNNIETILQISNKINKRKWGKYQATFVMKDHVTIEMINKLYPGLRMLHIEEVKMDTEESKRTKVHKKERDSVLMSPMLSPKEDDSEKEISTIGINRKISIVDDEASKLKPPPSPSKNPVCPILYITNLVRPFTLKQLNELLSRTGKIVDDGFWTDKIKSKCYVQYQNAEEAESTRNALHGVQWPIGNGKKLIIDFGTPESMLAAKNAVNEPPVTKTTAEDAEKVPETEKKEMKVDEKWEKSKTTAPVREWDLGKIPDIRSRSRSRERPSSRTNERRRHNRNESPSNGEHSSSRKKKREEATEVKLMDDLFHKTKATPCIYWLPLTPEQIAKKQQQRQQRMAEHKRRMEESRRLERDFGRGAARSRRHGARFEGD